MEREEKFEEIISIVEYIYNALKGEEKAIFRKEALKRLKDFRANPTDATAKTALEALTNFIEKNYTALMEEFYTNRKTSKMRIVPPPEPEEEKPTLKERLNNLNVKLEKERGNEEDESKESSDQDKRS